MSKFVTFSFDDGIEQDTRFVEMLNTYGFKATFNINTGIQTRANSWISEGVEIHRHHSLTFPKDPPSCSRGLSRG